MIMTRFSDGKTRLYVIVKKAILANANSDEARARFENWDIKYETTMMLFAAQLFASARQTMSTVDGRICATMAAAITTRSSRAFTA